MTADEIYEFLTPPVSVYKLQMALKEGMIPKKELVDGASYAGSCRNASQAVWTASTQRFVYTRYKFGESYEEGLPHPTDDEGSDIFVPVKMINTSHSRHSH